MIFDRDHASEIRVLGAVDAARALGEDEIRSALAFARDVGRDSTFTGRLSTLVWADESTVVKARPELSFTLDGLEHWASTRLQRERELGCYPADRTWFLVDGDRPQLAVAAHRRRPLHLWSPEELAAAWPRFSRDFTRSYVDAAVLGWRLDEGLSNFAWGDDEPLRYLDDDLYGWDEGVGLFASLRVLERKLPPLDVEHGEQLGASLREAFDPYPTLLPWRGVDDALGVGNGARGFLTAVAAALTRPRTRKKPLRTADSAASLLLVADIHANLDALEAVLASEDARAVEHILVLGDLVGYGPDPAAVIDRLADDPRVTCLLGNHDLAAVEGVPASFNRQAAWSGEWTRAALEPRHLGWLRSLPRELGGEGWLAVHGAPIDPERLNAYVYLMTASENLDLVVRDGITVCFHGNTHVAGSWVRRARSFDASFVPPTGPLELATVQAALVCPGGAGQPRDGLPGAAYAVYSREGGTVRFARAAYDPEPVRERMRAHDFPAPLVARLDSGR